MQSLNNKTLEISYKALTFITRKIRVSHLVKLKIAIGLALISHNESIAQKNKTFPDNPAQSDTLNIDLSMEEETFTLCYAVIIEDYKVKDPKYRGGQKALNDFIEENVKYPTEALENKIDGDVAVNLIVKKNGEIESADIIRGQGYGLDEEALRLVKLMPKLKPGKEDHEKTKMNKTIIIHFKLPDND